MTNTTRNNFPTLSADAREAKEAIIDRAEALALFSPKPIYMGRHRSE